jgi:hypothetical protein
VVLSGKDIEFLNHSLYTMQRFQAAKLAVLYVIVLLLLVGYRAPLMGYLLATAAMVCLYIFVVFAVAGLYAIARFSTQATERQLVLTGFALTLFGIATQFIAPALDLLNIKVV